MQSYVFHKAAYNFLTCRNYCFAIAGGELNFLLWTLLLSTVQSEFRWASRLGGRRILVCRNGPLKHSVSILKELI